MLIRKKLACNVCLIFAFLSAASLAGPTTQPLSEKDAAEKNKLLSISTCHVGYLKGKIQVDVKKAASARLVGLPTSKVRFALDGCSDVQVSRLIVDDSTDARKESVAGNFPLGEMRFSLSPARMGLHVLDQVFESGSSKIMIDRSWVEDIKRQNIGQLQCFRQIASWDRKAITDKPWPESAKMLALWDTFIADLISSGDRITEISNGDVTAFLSIRSSGDSCIASGKLFSSITNEWIGDLWMLYRMDENDGLEKAKDIIARFDASGPR